MTEKEKWIAGMWLALCIVTGFFLWPELVNIIGHRFGIGVEFEIWAMVAVTLMMVPAVDNGFFWLGLMLVTFFGVTVT